MERRSLDSIVTTQEYFRGEIRSAMDKQQVQANAATEFYLVSLLSSFSNRRLPDQALGLLMRESQAYGWR